MKVRITQRYKRKWCRNPVSGHQWPEDTLKNIWDVIGSVGIDSTHNTFEKAQIAADTLQAFYDKYFPVTA